MGHPVHLWPSVPDAEVHGSGPLVIGLRTALSGQRQGPRQQVRAAMVAVLAARLGCDASSIRVTSTPGNPPRLEGLDGTVPGLSISHAPGLSLLAIDWRGSVGVDLMHVDLELAGLDDTVALARDYLGPGVSAALAGCSPPDRTLQFARAWTAHEAGLKCLGWPMQETSTALQRRLTGLRFTPLALPDGYAGSLARQ